MPKKKNLYRTYGEKLISLFARLLFSREKHSLIALARMLNCSKQSVLRLIEDIQRSYRVEIEESFEGRKKYYRIKRPAWRPARISLTPTELNALHMCRTFSEHLMGRELFDETSRALEKSMTLLPENQNYSSHHFASFRPGSIDYTPYHGIIRTLLESMDRKKICKLTCLRIMADRAKTYYITPTVTWYVHAHLMKPTNPESASRLENTVLG